MLPLPCLPLPCRKRSFLLLSGTSGLRSWLPACPRDGISSSKACGRSHPGLLSTHAFGIAAALLPACLEGKGSLKTPLWFHGVKLFSILLYLFECDLWLLNVCVNGLSWRQRLLPRGPSTAGDQAARLRQKLSQEEHVSSQGSLEAPRGIHWGLHGQQRSELGSQTGPRSLSNFFD